MRTVFLLALPGLVVGCFSPTIPTDASIGCRGDADCPVGWFCPAALGVCVEGLDPEAPAVLDVAFPQTVGRGGAVEVCVTASKPLQEATILVGAFELAAFTRPDERFCGLSTAEEVGEGEHALFAFLADRSGNTATALLGQMRVDLTAPVLTIAEITPSLVGPGGRVDVTVVADEQVDGTAIVRVGGAFVDVIERPVSADVFSVAVFVPQNTAGGPVTISIEGIQDLAGNAAAAIEGSFVVDAEAPAVLIDAIPDVVSRQPGFDQITAQLTTSADTVAVDMLFLGAPGVCVGEGSQWVCEQTVIADPPPGPAVATFIARDAAGSSRFAFATVSVDLAGPLPVSGPVRLPPHPLQPAVVRLGAGLSAPLSLTFDELLAAPPTVVASVGDVVCAENENPLSWECTYSAPAAAGNGVVVDLTITALDRVGNSLSGPLVLPSPLVVDGEVAVPELVNMDVVHLDDSTMVLSAAPPGTYEAGALVQIVAPNGALVATTLADPNGAAPELSIINQTPSRLSVEQIDLAGNRSASIALVRHRARSTVTFDATRLAPLITETVFVDLHNVTSAATGTFDGAPAFYVVEAREQEAGGSPVCEVKLERRLCAVVDGNIAACRDIERPVSTLAGHPDGIFALIDESEEGEGLVLAAVDDLVVQPINDPCGESGIASLHGDVTSAHVRVVCNGSPRQVFSWNGDTFTSTGTIPNTASSLAVTEEGALDFIIGATRSSLSPEGEIVPGPTTTYPCFGQRFLRTISGGGTLIRCSQTPSFALAFGDEEVIIDDVEEAGGVFTLGYVAQRVEDGGRDCLVRLGGLRPQPCTRDCDCGFGEDLPATELATFCALDQNLSEEVTRFFGLPFSTPISAVASVRMDVTGDASYSAISLDGGVVPAAALRFRTSGAFGNAITISNQTPYAVSLPVAVGVVPTLTFRVDGGAGSGRTADVAINADVELVVDFIP
jgi:hypothetical protein